MRAIGNVVYAGVDYGRTFQRIEAKADIIRFDERLSTSPCDLGEGSRCADQILSAS
jgi:hypothetical protein